MIHVDDLVRAILLVADDDRANGEIFIAADGTPYSSRDIYNAMCNVLGKSIPKLLGDECYSSKKLEKLGFKAQKILRDMNETDF
jgi:UDP-glucose 4-epimerase